MAFTNYIQQITATNGTTHDLVDSSASHYVKGTQTSSTNAWTGALPDGVTAYYDGLSIDYFLPYAGTSTAATLNLGSKGAKPVYLGNSPTSGAVTTHFPVRSVIHMTYIINSSVNSGNGAWVVSAYYDSNTTAWSGISGKPTSTGSSATGITIAAHGTGTVIGVQSTTTTASKASGGNGSASSWTFEGKTVADSIAGAVDSTDTSMLIISLGTTTVQSKSGGGNGSAPTWSFTDVTVPIKNTSSSTFVTGTTHTVTDPKHTHTIG